MEFILACPHCAQNSPSEVQVSNISNLIVPWLQLILVQVYRAKCWTNFIKCPSKRQSLTFRVANYIINTNFRQPAWDGWSFYLSVCKRRLREQNYTIDLGTDVNFVGVVVGLIIILLICRREEVNRKMEAPSL